MRILGCALVLRMELYAYKEGMFRCGQLHYLGESGLRVVARCYESGLAEIVGIPGVELIAVAVTLGDELAAVNSVCKGILGDLAVICSQTHCAALHGGLFLILHHIDNGMLGIGVDLG